MPRALWNGTVVAEASPEEVETVEGNIYFPSNSVKGDYLQASEYHTECPWKGTASYYDLVVDGQVNKDAGWYYPKPKDAAAEIKDHVAFWRGVTVEQ